MGQTASPYPKLKRPATLDFLSSKPKPWRIVDIHGDLDAVRELREAEEEVGKAELAKADNLTDLRAKRDEAQRKVDASTRQMLVAGISRKAKEDLLADPAHAPREEDHKAAQEGSGNDKAKAQYNADTYPPALIAASLVEPKLSADEVRTLTEGWTEGEYMALWMATLGVNADSSLVAMGKASGSNGSNGTNGSTRN